MVAQYRVLRRMVSMIAALIGLLSACTVYDESANVAETVDEAVSLLQDIEQRGSWEVIGEGLDALNDQETGYRAHAHLVTREQDTIITELMISIEVDGAHHARIQIIGGETAGDYLILDYHPDADANQVYRIADNGYMCLSGDDVPRVFQSGINGLFDTVAAQARGIQTLSVVDRTDDELSIAGRASIHYALESRLDEAVLILNRLENEALQPAVQSAGQFELTGNLYLDEETLALLVFDSTYHQIETQQQISFDFEITQWDDIPTIPFPTSSEITTECD